MSFDNISPVECTPICTRYGIDHASFCPRKDVGFTGRFYVGYGCVETSVFGKSLRSSLRLSVQFQIFQNFLDIMLIFQWAFFTVPDLVSHTVNFVSQIGQWCDFGVILVVANLSQNGWHVWFAWQWYLLEIKPHPGWKHKLKENIEFEFYFACQLLLGHWTNQHFLYMHE